MDRLWYKISDLDIQNVACARIINKEKALELAANNQDITVKLFVKLKETRDELGVLI